MGEQRGAGSLRWFTEFGPEHSHRYVERFRALAASGTDVDGEARLVDALLPRGARVLDGGCGPGRVGAALAARGHAVTGVDADGVLIAAAQADHPEALWIVEDLADYATDEPYDAVVLAGNVLVYVAPGTEATVIAGLVDCLAPGGVFVCGFATDREYTVADLDHDAAATGLVLEHRFATWDLRPWHADAGWAVGIFRKPLQAAPVHWASSPYSSSP
ncbi:class I SAM-dependent methyltransferase [uncultured Jatrophihabitans sp.]|uniref:class I SAM-dependent methyltransferase n=1 Tax=uncultured Jatrophihabitans sp. TaxID=1610747 RepID=UPI0035C9FE04